MFANRSRGFRWALGALMAGSMVLGGCGGHHQRRAHVVLEMGQRTITVVGEGEVTTKPDIARTNMGIEVSAPTVAEAMTQARTRMNDLMTALKRLGIAENDVQTSNFSVSFERQYYAPPQPPMPYYGAPPEAAPSAAPPPAAPAPRTGGKAAPKGAPTASPPAAATATAMPAPPPMPPSVGVYRVSNMVEIKIRDLNKVSDVLDTMVAAGANNVWGVSFAVDEPKPLEAQAREKATADAKARAERLAKLSGVTLGRVVSVSEVVGRGGMPYPMPMMAKAAMQDAGGGGTPVSPGELKLTSQVEVVYAIAEPANDEGEDD